MEQQLKCDLLLSLKEMALRRVVVLLWSGSTIFDYDRRSQTLKRIIEVHEEIAKDKIPKLKLPESLRKQMEDIVPVIGNEIQRWKVICGSFFSPSNQIGLLDPGKLCWTTAGAIDDRKLAEQIVRWEVPDVEQRYKLACCYCLEDHIPRLWEQLPEARKEFYQKERARTSQDVYKSWGKEGDLAYSWPHILRGELSNLDYFWRNLHTEWTSFYQFAFEFCAREGNKSAAEYFYQKLPHEEIGASLMRTLHGVLSKRTRSGLTNYSDVFCYLFSLMTPEQRMEVVKAKPIKVLLSFLEWPWFDLLPENAGLVWNLIPPSSYGDLLGDMTKRILFSHRYFSKLFREFFSLSPLDFKEMFANAAQVRQLLYNFLHQRDSVSVKVIFKSMDAAGRARLVFHPKMLTFFCSCLSDERWRMVELCLREAELSREDTERLREDLTLRLQEDGCDSSEFDFLKRCFAFFDGTDSGVDEGEKTLLAQAGLMNVDV